MPHLRRHLVGSSEGAVLLEDAAAVGGERGFPAQLVRHGDAEAEVGTLSSRPSRPRCLLRCHRHRKCLWHKAQSHSPAGQHCHRALGQELDRQACMCQ